MSQELSAHDLFFTGIAIFRECICPLIGALLLFFAIFGCSPIRALSSSHHARDLTTS